jgi:hypothetical protein
MAQGSLLTCPDYSTITQTVDVCGTTGTDLRFYPFRRELSGFNEIYQTQRFSRRIR